MRNINPSLALSFLVTSTLFVSVIGDKGTTFDDGFESFLDEVQELLSPKTDFTSEEDVTAWLEYLNRAMAEDSNKVALANWNYETNLTEDNLRKRTDVNLESKNWESVQLGKAKQFLKNSANFVGNSDIYRMLRTFVNSAPFVSSDSAITKALEDAESKLEAVYNAARVTKGGKSYSIEPELTEVMSTSRDYDELLWAWRGWRDAIGPKAKPSFTEVVTMRNLVARKNGFSDAGEAWRISNYEIDNIETMTHVLYEEMAPLYEQLHAYVRRKLIQLYPGRGIDPKGPIPAHILGNMWGQQWTGIIDVVTPFPDVSSHNVTGALQNYTAEGMFKMAEDFFTSLGLDPMTSKFWKKSMIEKPIDRDVVCHGSADDMHKEGDFRIKMCTVKDLDSLTTIHHEMGHIQYFMCYTHQPTVYQEGANSAFHEAIGDTIALSAKSTAHLKAVGLLDETPENDGQNEKEDYERDINFLMAMAMEKIAFLPYGYLIDRWRWEVFRGDVTPANYNKRYGELRLRYQGVAPPVGRSDDDFDPAAKYHVSVFIPYIRYFLSFIGQFQFHQSLCNAAGHAGPLHKCDIYRSKKAGDLLKSMLNLGSSKPWPEAMEVITGQRKFDTAAILEYFKPLHDWLKRENAEEEVGWTND